MAKLRVFVKGDGVQGNKRYLNEVNADNFKDIALVLKDLENLGLPIKKSIKEYNLSKSDWDASLAFN